MADGDAQETRSNSEAPTGATEPARATLIHALDTKGSRREPTASENLLENLARSLASLHGARDLRELAGQFERIGEQCVEAIPTVLMLADGTGRYRQILGSLRRPAFIDERRRQLGLTVMTMNPEISRACRQVNVDRRSGWFSMGDLFHDAVADDRRCLVVPITVSGEELGAALFVVSESKNAAKFASIAAEHAGIAMLRLRELEQARRLPGIDGDLWISDEPSVREALAVEIGRARRYGGGVGLTLLTVDGEAHLRATYGHFYTNHLLRRVGSFLKTEVRDCDVLGAIDGRFAIVHPATTRAGSEIAAERLAGAVGAMLSETYPELDVQLVARIRTNSVAAPEDGLSANELVEAVIAVRGESDGRGLCQAA